MVHHPYAGRPMHRVARRRMATLGRQCVLLRAVATALTLKPRVMINIRYTPTTTFGAEKGRLPRDPMSHSLFRTLRPQVQDLYRASLAVTV